MIVRLSKNLIFIVLLSTCTMPIEIVTKRTGGDVVISGQLSSIQEIPDKSFVYVGITAETERLPFPVSGAVVNLFEGDELIDAYTEDTIIPGRYVLRDYAGVPGKTYHVQVILPDSRIYESVPEKMPDHAGLVSTYYKIEREEFIDFEGTLVKQYVIKIFANSTLPEVSNPYLLWTVEEVFIVVGTAVTTYPFTQPPCFVAQNADPQTIVLLDRQHLEANVFPDHLLATRVVDYSFMLRHYFTTYQTTLTKEAYDYWRKVEVVVSQNGSMFDTPPAIVHGNISSNSDKSEKVFGYFQTSNQSLHRILLTRQDFPFFLYFNDCTGNGPPPTPQRCWDCLSVRNSSHEEPPWF